MTATFTTGELIITLVSVATLAGIFGFWLGAHYWRQFERDCVEREKRSARLSASIADTDKVLADYDDFKRRVMDPLSQAAKNRKNRRREYIPTGTGL